MAWLIMNDEVDYPAMWYPTHIVTKDKKLVNVFIGASGTLLGGYGIWINENDYNKIRHDKAYVFIHNPDATEEDINEIDWDKIEDVTDNKLDRDHIHIWKEPEFEGGK